MIGRREFVTLLGGAAVGWPLAARAQQAAPMVGFVSGAYHERSVPLGAAFRKGLNESGIIEGQNATIEERWLDGRYERLPSLMADLVRRGVAVIASPDSATATSAAKDATTTIPIVFGTAADPVQLGLVASLAGPGGNATGINFLIGEVAAKRLSLLHELVPKAGRIAVLVNSANAVGTEATLRDVSEAAPALGLQITALKASTGPEIDTAFASLARERVDAVFVAPDVFFGNRSTQIAILAAHYWVPTAHANRPPVEAGGLMSYGTDIADVYRLVGLYTGRILKGAKPADLPVLQTAKFEFVINLHTAKLLGLDVSPSLLATADEVIE